MGRLGDRENGNGFRKPEPQDKQGFIARLVPSQLRSLDPRARLRATMLLSSSLAGSLATLLLVLYLLHLQQAEAAFLNLSFFAGLALTPLVLRRSRSVKVAAHWALGCAFVILMIESCWFGGVTSPAFPWLASLAVAGMFFAGRRGGLLWVALSTLGIVSVAVFELVGWIRHVPQLADKQIVQEMFTMGSFSLALAGIAWLAEARSNRVVRELERESQMFRAMSLHDFLTGLANRSLIDESLTQSWERCRRANTGGALFFVDLNGFKAINDTRGHAAGDQVLREVAHRLTSLLRRSDVAGRIGGDEFALLIEGLDTRPKAAALADKIARVIETPIEIQGGPVQVGASIGIALYPDLRLDSSEPLIAGVRRAQLAEPTTVDRTTIERLFRRADTAMYTAKRRQQRYWIHGEPDVDRATGRMRKVVATPRNVSGPRQPAKARSSSRRSTG